MLTYLEFIILFTISSIVMYVLDAVIAMFVPAWRVKKTLLMDETIDLISGKYGKAFLKEIKPQIQKEMDALTTRMETDIITTQGKIEQKVHDELSTALTNDIPHILNEQLEPFKAKIDGLNRFMGANMSIRNSTVKSQKEAERLSAMMYIMKNKPEHANLLKFAFSLQKAKVIGKGDFNKLVDGLCTMMEMEQLGDTEKMSLLQGNAFAQAGISALQEEPQGRVMAEMMAGDNSNALRDEFERLGADPKDIASVFDKNEVEEIKEIGENENGTQEKETT